MNTSTNQVSIISPTAGSRAEYILGFDPDDRSSPDETYETIRAEDEAASAQESDLFDLKVRRAYKLGYLKKNGYHRKKNQSWKAFVTNNFPWGGYDVWRRYYPCAVVQKDLHDKGLPLAQTEFQTRLLAPLLRKPDEATLIKLRELVAAKGGVLPQACEIQAAFPKTPPPKKKTAPDITPPVNPFKLVLSSYPINSQDLKALLKLANKYDPATFPKPVSPPKKKPEEPDLFSTQSKPSSSPTPEVMNAC